MEDKLLDKAIENTPLHTKGGVYHGTLGELVNKVADNFLDEQLKAFPGWCAETRAVNFSMRKHFYHYGHKGKYAINSANEDNYGFSKDKNFYHKWVVPKPLEFFMRNCIYKEFWSDDNKKVRDSFMKAVLKGTKEPMQLLSEVRSHYGSHNSTIEQ